MEIDYFNFSTLQGQEITMGLNIQHQFGMTYVNMFSLKENQGPRLSHNLWTAAKAITTEVLPGQNIENIQWSFVMSGRVCRIQFSTLNGEPYKIDLSDKHALEQESACYKFGGYKPKTSNHAYNLEKYSEIYTGAIPAKGEKVLTLRYPEIPLTVFQVPCYFRAAKDAVFHCQPSYMGSDYRKDDWEFILADTAKVIEQLRKDDPSMLEHADRKAQGMDFNKRIEKRAIDSSYDMGHWTHSDVRGFTLSSGDASLIRLVQDVQIPYFPITSTKGDGADKIRELVGYAPAQRAQMHPAFSGPI